MAVVCPMRLYKERLTGSILLPIHMRGNWPKSGRYRVSFSSPVQLSFNLVLERAGETATVVKETDLPLMIGREFWPGLLDLLYWRSKVRKAKLQSVPPPPVSTTTILPSSPVPPRHI